MAHKPILQVIPVSIYWDAAVYKKNAGTNCHLGIGVHVTIAGNVAKQYCRAFYGGMGTNNTGEWIGLITALEVAEKIIGHHRASGKIEPMCTLYGDSELVVRQFSGVYTTSDKFIFYKNKAMEIYERIEPFIRAVAHVRREYNREADALSKQGIADLYKRDGLVFDPTQGKHVPITP